MKWKKKKRKMLALCFSFVMVFSIIPLRVISPQPIKAAGYGISNPSTDAIGISTWDCVTFGNYWQSDTNGDGTADQSDEKEPIKWRVLSVNGDDAFLLADANLDVQVYNEEYIEVTWETSTLRSWLNSDFYNAAFSDAEKSAIKTTKVVNEDNPEEGTEGGNETNDKVYLLSIGEAMNPLYGFSSKDYTTETREAADTAYAANRELAEKEAGETSYWWLRSPGGNSWKAAEVFHNGKVYSLGGESYADVAVRPVLHLDLSSGKWSKAGTVSALGGSIGGSTATAKPTSSAKPDTSAKPTGTAKPASSSKPTDKPAKVTAPGSVKKLTAKNKKKKAVTLSWKKVNGAKGYQIQYALNKKLTKKKKSKIVTKTKFTVKKLIKNKTYYFRVRAYKLDGKTKVYGKWSKIKKVKIKK